MSALPTNSNYLELFSVLALLSLLPFAAMVLTSYAKILVVLSMLRGALGSLQTPPSTVLAGLAMALSAVVMAPTAREAWDRANSLSGSLPSRDAFVQRLSEASKPLRAFMVRHGSASERARLTQTVRELRTHARPGAAQPPPDGGEDSFAVVAVAFLLTELREAFIIGFMLFLPFMVVDMVVANVLLALGMQSLSASQISVPFKILLFVAADGWSLVARGLLLGYR